MFKVKERDLRSYELALQGAYSKNSNVDISMVKFQNYDNDNATVWDMAAISMRDHDGNTLESGRGDLVFYTSPGQSVLHERARILYNGNIGVNTPTPQFQFDVNGSLRAQSYVNLPSATLGITGITRLNDTISTSTTTAATPSLVKSVYDYAQGLSNWIALVESNLHGFEAALATAESQSNLVYYPIENTDTWLKITSLSNDMTYANSAIAILESDVADLQQSTATLNAFFNDLSDSTSSNLAYTLNISQTTSSSLASTQAYVATFSNALSSLSNYTYTYISKERIDALAIYTLCNVTTIDASLTALEASHATLSNATFNLVQSNASLQSRVSVLEHHDSNLANITSLNSSNIVSLTSTTSSLDARTTALTTSTSATQAQLASLSNAFITHQSDNASFSNWVVDQLAQHDNDLLAESNYTHAAISELATVFTTASNDTASRFTTLSNALTTTNIDLTTLSNATHTSLSNTHTSLSTLSNVVFTVTSALADDVFTINTNHATFSNAISTTLQSTDARLETLSNAHVAWSNDVVNEFIAVSMEVVTLSNSTQSIFTSLSNYVYTLSNTGTSTTALLSLPFTTPPTTGTPSSNMVYSDSNDGLLKMITPCNAVFTLGPYFINQHSYLFTEDTNTSISASIANTFVDKIRWTSPALAAGTYRIAFSAATYCTTANQKTGQVNGWINNSNAPWSQNGITFAQGGTGASNTTYGVSDFTVRNLNAGTHVFGVNFAPTTGTTTLFCTRAIVELWRLS
jgi:trimeric autotransporter adhesin